MYHTADELLRMSRANLTFVAARLGLRVVGVASAVLIDRIMVRVGEVAAKAMATPVDVRLAVLEDGLARLETALVEQGSAISMLFDVVRALAAERGVAVDSRLRPIAIKLKARQALASGVTV